MSGASVTRAWLVLVLLLPGCSLVLGYPAPVDDERGALCANGVDDDLDGRADCLDSSCASPMCSERSDLECDDGWDDDADGLADALDPDCWRRAQLEVQRCVPVGPSTFEPSFDRLDSGWRQILGASPTLVPDPARPERMAARAESPLMLASDPMAGAAAGLVMTFEIRGAAGATTVIGLTRDGTTPSIAPEGVTVVVGGDGTLFVGGSNQLWPIGDVPLEDPVVGRIEIFARVAPDGTRLRPGLRVTANDAVLEGDGFFFGTAGQGEAPLAFEDGVALQAMFFADGTGPMLVDAHVEMGVYDDCITDGSAADAPLLPHPVLGVARGGGTTCVITRGDAPPDPPTRLVSRRSLDGGLHWEAELPLFDVAELGLGPILGHSLDVTTVPLAYTEGGFVGIAALQTHGDGFVVATRLVRSSDCVTWRVDATGLDLELPATSLGMFQAYSIDARSGEHEISFVDFGNLGTAVLLRATSGDGAPGTFRFTGDVVNLPEPPEWGRYLYNGLRAYRVGANRVLVFAESTAVRAYVEAGSGEWTLLDSPLFEASARVGTFDERSIVTPLVSFDAASESDPGRLTGVVAYGGAVRCTDLSDPSSCDTASIVSSFEVLPR
jgi:hypothetical protein